MLEIQIRQAGIHDLGEILRQRRAMFHDAGYTDTTALDAMQETSEPYIREGLLSGKFVAWIAETSDSEPMGCGAVLITSTPSHPLDPQCRRAVILNVYTYPQYRRQGIARRLMETMIAWCRTQDFASVSLHASRDGRALYESLGFHPTSEMRLSLKPNPRCNRNLFGRHMIAQTRKRELNAVENDRSGALSAPLGNNTIL